MDAKDFLRTELDNIRESLEEALRFDYGPSGSQRFFEECLLRFTEFEKRWSFLLARDFEGLTELARAIRDFGRLVHNIERANETEVSWPFVEATKKFAEGFLREDLPGNKGAPLILACAAGGIDNYLVHPEDLSQSLGVRSPIHIIEFPRTLKHYVLVHPIFAHEIGHAAWETPKFANNIPPRVQKTLRADGPLSNDLKLKGWLQKSSASGFIRELRDEMRENWPEEIFSDLFGIYTFGPSYAWAFKTLIFGMDPEGKDLTRDHPPAYVRAFVLNAAWAHLGWDKPSRYSKRNNAVATEFARGPFRKFTFPMWASSLVTVSQVHEILDVLKALPASPIPLSCPIPEPKDFQSLVKKISDWTPPCGAGQFDVEKGPALSFVDFRNILVAGWYAWAAGSLSAKDFPETKRFKVINRLCGMGIAHQIAIDHFVANGGPAK